MVRELKEELDICKDKIETFTKQNAKLENELATMDKKSQELSSKNHEIAKLLHKMQEGLSKKEQVTFFH